LPNILKTLRSVVVDDWTFVSDVLKIEETNEYNPDPNLKSSDGWGFELASWLEPQLQRLGYNVAKFEPDTCGWRLELPFDDYQLVLTCMAIEASSVSNRDELGLDSRDVWQLFASAKGPHAQGGLLKRMFAKPDPERVAQRDLKLSAFKQHVNQILSSEPTIHFLTSEPEFDSGFES
jgi:hypothetical protein